MYLYAKYEQHWCERDWVNAKLDTNLTRPATLRNTCSCGRCNFMPSPCTDWAASNAIVLTPDMSFMYVRIIYMHMFRILCFAFFLCFAFYFMQTSGKQCYYCVLSWYVFHVCAFFKIYTCTCFAFFSAPNPIRGWVPRMQKLSHPLPPPAQVPRWDPRLSNKVPSVTPVVS